MGLPGYSEIHRLFIFGKMNKQRDCAQRVATIAPVAQT